MVAFCGAKATVIQYTRTQRTATECRCHGTVRFLVLWHGQYVGNSKFPRPDCRIANSCRFSQLSCHLSPFVFLSTVVHVGVPGCPRGGEFAHKVWILVGLIVLFAQVGVEIVEFGDTVVAIEFPVAPANCGL